MMEVRSIKELILKTSDSNQENRIERLLEWQPYMENFSKENWETLWQNLGQIHDEKAKLALGMACLDQIPVSDKYETYLSGLIAMKNVDWDEKYYMMWQVNARLFSNPDLNTRKIEKLQFQLYHHIISQFQENFTNLKYLSNRNSNLVFVTAQQYLGLDIVHAPSKVTLDRARVLQKKLGKTVIIINTMEMLGGRIVSLYRGIQKNYVKEFATMEQIEYEGEVFPYMQFDNDMPNLQNAADFFSFVEKYKPEYIVNIGGASLLIDTCSKLVPVLNANTVESAIEKTEATVQVLGRKVKEEDEELLKLIGKSKEDVIVGRVTSALRPQICTYTRQELGIPEDAFVMLVVGARLNTEFTQEFLDTIHQALEKGAVLVIIGPMDSYLKFCDGDEIFRRQSCFLGAQTEFLAILDHCDLYVNPKRAGGGISVVEAMYKGCPAVTLNQGDVALGTGEEFCVSTYDEMQDIILKYMTDKEFYDKMSKKARKRAEYMLDSDSAVTEIIRTFESKIRNRE